MELELRHLRVVCRLADTGSVSKAAAALGVSQPSLTAQLHRIEDAIGGPLFERGPYGVLATPLGKHVLSRARAMLADMDELVGSSRRYTTTSGVLRIGAVRTVMFGAWLSRLEQLLPGRQIAAQVDPSCAVLTDLLAADVIDVVMLGRCDDAHAPPCPPGIREQTMVWPEPFAVALPADHRLADKDAVALEELSDEIWICPPAGKEDGDLAYLRSVCESVGFTPEFRYANLDTSEIEQLIGAGRGISLCAPTVREIPNTIVLPILGQPLLWRRALRWRVPDGPALTGPDGTRHDIPPKVHEVMKYVEDALRQGYALQIIPRRHELPIDEAADAVSMPREELRLLVSQGEIPFRSSEYVDWVRLSDAIAVSNRLDAEREKMLQSFAEEEPWDDDTPGNG